MKKYSFLLFVVFIAGNCLAQSDSDLLRNINYCSASSNKKVAQLKVTKDSLFVTSRLGASIVDKDRYKIIGQEQRGEYSLIYVQKNPQYAKQVRIRSAQLPLFSVFVFHFSDSGSKLYLLHEDKELHSAQAVINANITTPFKQKYFYTWYPEAVFVQCTGYPDLKNADENLTQKVASNLFRRMNANKAKLQNTRSNDLYNTAYLQDNLTKTLVNNQLNPLMTIADFSNKLAEYHIVFPAFSTKWKSTPPAKINRIHPGEKGNSKNDDDIRIDEPGGNSHKVG